MPVSFPVKFKLPLNPVSRASHFHRLWVWFWAPGPTVSNRQDRLLGHRLSGQPEQSHSLRWQGTPPEARPILPAGRAQAAQTRGLRAGKGAGVGKVVDKSPG